MGTTKSTAAERAAKAHQTTTSFRNVSSWQGLTAMLAASVVVLLGLCLVFLAKGDDLKATDTLNLNALTKAAQITPHLTVFPNAAEREFVAQKILSELKSAPNVGALAKLRVTESELAAKPQLAFFQERLATEKKRATAGKEIRLGLFTPAQFTELKSAFIVRTPQQFRTQFFLWVGAYLLALYAAFFVWARGSADKLLLPAAHILSGLGLMLMVSIRDPLRDMLSLADFVQGVVMGCVVLIALRWLQPERLERLVYVPLLLGVLLSLALILFGSGPTGSDAKVNLFGTQPVEAIKILIVIFLAGFFADRWAGLRSLTAKSEVIRNVLTSFAVPRAKDFIPVVLAMGLVLLFFFLQKDLGPALILACTFLVLYTVARKRVGLAALGLSLLITGFYLGYRFDLSHTVRDRIKIWLSPWDNTIGGGIQLVHSFWALATGASTGMGLGLGDPEIVPAIHTDLILAAVGEELGFVGLLAVFALYALLIFRGLNIALRSSGAYSFFLALGLTSLTALQIFLIAGGILGLIPLSGVVSPFLSYGKSSMIASFAVVGMLLAISAQAKAEHADAELQQHFGVPVKWAGVVFALLVCAVLGKAAWIQLVRPDPTLIAGTLTLQGDGAMRYQYNPRLEKVARLIPKGTIYDRNGIPLATSNWQELKSNQAKYQQLGVTIDAVCSQQDLRHYPFGGLTFHLLGDRRTRVNWASRNASYVERDYSDHLAGYEDNAQIVEVKNAQGKTNLAVKRDYSEVIPLLRYRYRPNASEVRRILDRDRNVKLSIDIALQQRVAAIVRDKIREAKKERGAAVVMDADTGDVLAAVSYPWPEDLRLLAAKLEPDDDDEEENDIQKERDDYAKSERFDRAFWGIYPPGSTFKIVTSIAALRKDAQAINDKFNCVPMGGRQGAMVQGRAILDDESDGAGGHGNIGLDKAIEDSCNAYFAQSAVERIGAESFFQTASQMDLAFTQGANKDALQKAFRDSLAQAAFGQGVVFVTPFQMARVAATVANGGQMPYGRWVTDASNKRNNTPAALITNEQANYLANAMRGVVTQGTAKRLANTSIAGKTGTAENQKGKASHSWFIGFAPYDAPAQQRIAFSVIVENGSYGGRLAAPIAGEIVAAAFNPTEATLAQKQGEKRAR
jgi:cell division protein FtsW (lipid II flippase)/beta-lactamase class D